METTNIAYDVCRYYVDDALHLPQEVRSVIYGFIRARRYDLLSEVGTLHVPAKHGRGVFQELRQIEAFFSKNADFADESVCSEAARLSFIRGEKLCRITNRRLDYYSLNHDRLDPDIKDVIFKMQRIIRNALGPLEHFTSSLPERVRVSSGATEASPRVRSLPYLKIRKRLRAPREAWPYLTALSKYFGYGELLFEQAELNRVELVPKSWKTHRTIACEPAGLMPLQLAFDSFVKERLSRFLDVDLFSQEKNQLLAKEGSIADNLSTLDLSMASDTLAINCVAWLLPDDWFLLLNRWRSKGYKGIFGYGVYSKFSSMGNGMTFGLETLVFASLCKAVGAKTYAVYGDDIVIPRQHDELVRRVLKFLGFIVNHSKSFSHGPFRESCGKEFYEGYDVTPFRLRLTPRDKPGKCHLINGLASVSYPDGKLWSFLRSIFEESPLLTVPYNGSSTSGVWITPYDAYERGAIRNVRWELRYKAYVNKTRGYLIRDSRTLFLWHLQKGKAPSRCCITTQVPLISHKYVTRLIHWYPPADVTPAHLYRWADFLFRLR